MQAKMAAPARNMAWILENKTLSPVEQAYNYILQGILSGDLAPGMRVPTESVAEALGISRMPVRDALRRLEGDGAVTIYANRGATVAEYSHDDVVQLIEMRAVLEALGARLAMANIGRDEIEEFTHLKERMDRAADDLPTWITRHDDFHNYLTSLSRRPLLMRQTERIRMMLRPYFRRHHAEQQELEIPGHEHQKIVDAVMTGNPDAVEQTVRAHALANVEKIASLT